MITARPTGIPRTTKPSRSLRCAVAPGSGRDRADIREGNSVDGVVPDGRLVEADSGSVLQREQRGGWRFVSIELRWSDGRGAPTMTASHVHCEEQHGDEFPSHCVLPRRSLCTRKMCGEPHDGRTPGYVESVGKLRIPRPRGDNPGVQAGASAGRTLRGRAPSINTAAQY